MFQLIIMLQQYHQQLNQANLQYQQKKAQLDKIQESHQGLNDQQIQDYYQKNPQA